jgi:outer membrane protein
MKAALMKTWLRLLLVVPLLLAAHASQAEDLLAVWRAAQARDPAYAAARQSLQFAQSPAQLRQAQERFRLAEQDLALRVGRSYFETLVAGHNADLALAQLNLMAQQLRSAQRETGAVGAALVRDAQQRFDQARVARVTAAREAERRRAELEKLMGRAPGALEGLRDDAVLWSPEPADAGFWATLASEEHPRVRLQMAALEAAGAEVERRRDTEAPDVDVAAGRSRLFGSSPLPPSERVNRGRTPAVGLVLTVPLADTTPDGRVREAMVAQDKAEVELSVARATAAGPARQAFEAVMDGLARSKALAAAVRTGRGVLESAQHSVRAGLRLPADLLAAAQQSYATERDWLRTRAETALYGLALKAAAGRLGERDMAEVDGWLAPQALAARHDMGKAAAPLQP